MYRSMVTATETKPMVRHEDFCVREDPRIERYTAYRDNDAGRSTPAMKVERCLECGAAKYEPLN